jgi:hypothetical protein
MPAPHNPSESRTLLPPTSTSSDSERNSSQDFDFSNYPVKKKRGFFNRNSGPAILHLFIISLYTTVFLALWDTKEAHNATVSTRHKTGLHAYCKLSASEALGLQLLMKRRQNG